MYYYIIDQDKLIEIRRRIYNNVISKRNSLTKSKYKVGDIVRIKMYNDKTRQNWSDELYKIQKVHKSRKIYTVPYYYLSIINVSYGSQLFSLNPFHFIK